MPVSDILKEDVQREIQRLRGSGEEVYEPLIETWPGPSYDPQDPRTYPSQDNGRE